MSGDRLSSPPVRYYEELWADFRREQARIAAVHHAKITGRAEITGRQRVRRTPEPAERGGRAEFDEDDFSNNTWLR